MNGYVHPAGGGDAYVWHDAHIVIKASGAETLGQLAVVESTYPAGLSVHPHVHRGEDEMFYLLDGKILAFCEGDEWTVGPGSFVFVPRDHLHGFEVVGDAPARALVIVGPSGLDRDIINNGSRVASDQTHQRPRDRT